MATVPRSIILAVIGTELRHKRVYTDRPMSVVKALREQHNTIICTEPGTPKIRFIRCWLKGGNYSSRGAEMIADARARHSEAQCERHGTKWPRGAARRGTTLISWLRSRAELGCVTFSVTSVSTDAMESRQRPM